MSKLEEIKARAEAAVEARLEFNASGDDASSLKVALIAERSSYDVPKLVAALEAVEALLSERATGFRETSDRLNQQVINRDPGMDAETAHRYAVHAQSSESALRMVQRAITEALA